MVTKALFKVLIESNDAAPHKLPCFGVGLIWTGTPPATSSPEKGVLMPLVQVVPQNGRWIVQQDGRSTRTFQTQDEAAQAAKQQAKSIDAEFQLHGTDGQIREKNSYGNDPSDIKG